MKVSYKQGRYAKCTECHHNIFITEADAVVRDGNLLIEMTCKTPGCAAYGIARLYDENMLEIYQAATAAG